MAYSLQIKELIYLMYNISFNLESHCDTYISLKVDVVTCMFIFEFDDNS